MRPHHTINVTIALLIVAVLWSTTVAGGWTMKDEFVSPDPNGRFGETLAAGDIDGDGLEDLVVSSYLYDKVRVFYGNTDGDLDAPITVPAPQSGAFGRSLAVGDVNGDGFDDIIAGAPNVGGFGTVFVLPGGPHRTFPSSISLTPFTGDARFGFSVATGDFDADGFADVLVGAPDTTGDFGQAYLFLGGELFDDSPDLKIKPFASASSYIGYSTLLVDVTGDGKDDAIIGAPGNGANLGGIYFVEGTSLSRNPENPNSSSVDHNILKSWSDPYLLLGSELASLGDVTGDGINDIYVTAPGGTFHHGYVFKGDGTVTSISSTPDISIDGSVGDELGLSVVSSDWDGDGETDLIVTHPGFTDGTNSSGLAIYLGPGLSGTLTAGDADVIVGLPGDDTGSNSTVTDMDGDGIDDIIVSDPGHSTNDGYIGLYSIGSPVFSVALDDSPMDVIPPYQDRTVSVTMGATGDILDIDASLSGINGGTVEVLEMDGETPLFDQTDDGSPDTGYIAAGATYSFIVRTSASDGTADGHRGSLSINMSTGSSGHILREIPVTVSPSPREITTVIPGGDLTDATVLIGRIRLGATYDDLIVGQPGHDNDTGIVRIYYGEDLVNGQLDAVPRINITGSAEGDRFGATLALGEVLNNDAAREVVIGAPGYANNRGRIYVKEGETTPTTGNITSASLHTAITGPDGTFGFGTAIAVGEVDNTNQGDILVSSWFVGGTGRVYLYLSSSSNTIDGAHDMNITGPAGESSFGRTIEVADVHEGGEPGRWDMIIGSPEEDRHIWGGNGPETDVGVVRIFKGTASLASINLSTEWADVTILGDTEGGRFGWDLAGSFGEGVLRDFDNDGGTDLAIASHLGDRTTLSIFTYDGFGSSNLSSSDADITFVGLPGGTGGSEVVGTDDMDNDGYGDLLVTAVSSPDPTSGSDATMGSYSVIYGGPYTGGGTTDMLTEAVSNGTVRGTLPGGAFAAGVSIGGSIIPDGRSDIAIIDEGDGNDGRIVLYSKRSPAPVFSVDSPVTLVVADKGTEAVITFTITNDRISADTFELSVAGSNLPFELRDGTDTPYTDTDADGTIDTGAITSGSTATVKVAFTINASTRASLTDEPTVSIASAFWPHLTETVDLDIVVSDPTYLHDSFTGGAASETGYDMASADLNGDGFQDLVVARPGSDRVDIILGGGMDLDPDVTLTGPTNSRFGDSVAVGDINGDGLDDLVVGAPDKDAGDGAVYVYVQDQGISTTGHMIELATNLEYFGDSVAIGDANNDSFDDILVGAPTLGGGDNGKAYLYLGGTTIPLTYDAQFAGDTTGDYFGSAVAFIGDYNGDGYDDWAIGGPRTNYGALYGLVRIFTGKDDPDNVPTLTIIDEEDMMDFGFHLEGVGDLDGDGTDDIAISKHQKEGGWVYVYGGDDLVLVPPGSTRTTAALPPSRLYKGESNGDIFGSAISSADINGDGHTDLLIASHETSADIDGDGINETGVGVLYAFYGPQDLSVGGGPVTMAGEANWTDHGSADSGSFGVAIVPISLSVQSGTGTWSASDVAWSSSIIDGASGEVRLVSTGQGAYHLVPPGSDAMTSPGSTVTFQLDLVHIGDPQAIDLSATVDLGWTTTFLMGDGTTPFLDTDGSGTVDTGYLGTDSRRTVMLAITVPGGASPGDLAELTVTTNSTSAWRNLTFTIRVGAETSSLDTTTAANLGDPGDNGFGETIVPAGDLNGDGFGDVLVLQEAHTGNIGLVRILYGNPNGTMGTSPGGLAPVELAGGAAGDLFGSAATVSDINSDGFPDLLISSRGEGPKGVTRVYYGEEGIDHSPDTTPDLILPGGGTGVTVGDINDDGYPDVALGTSAGTVEVYYGRSMWFAIPDVTITGPSAIFGTSLELVDVTGDGMDDLFVGDPAAFGTGSVLVFNGSDDWNATMDQTNASLFVNGSYDGGEFGTVFSVADMDDDGLLDLVASAPTPTDFGVGHVYVYMGTADRWVPGTADSLFSSANTTLRGESIKDRFGASILVADIDADGQGELFVGAPRYGQDAGRVLGFDSSSVINDAGGLIDSLDIAYIVWEGSDGDRFGESLCGLLLDNDGHEEVAVGGKTGGTFGDLTTYELVTTSPVLSVHPVPGPVVDGTGNTLVADPGANVTFLIHLRNPTDASLRIDVTPESDGATGIALRYLSTGLPVLDTDGDSLVDVVLSAGGEVMLVYELTVDPALATADTLVAYLNTTGNTTILNGMYTFTINEVPTISWDATLPGLGEIGLGTVMATGDVDGDGSSDILVSTGSTTGLGTEAVILYLGGHVHHPDLPERGLGNGLGWLAEEAIAALDGTDDPVDHGADIMFLGGRGFGSAVVLADMNADGFPDVVISDPLNDRVLVYFMGRVLDSEPDVVIQATGVYVQGAPYGAGSLTGFGSHLVNLGDITGDGATELGIGSADHSRIFIYRGETSHGPTGATNGTWPDWVPYSIITGVDLDDADIASSWTPGLTDALRTDGIPSGGADLPGMDSLGVDTGILDMDGDGEPELVVGSPGSLADDGRVIIIPGDALVDTNETGADELGILSLPAGGAIVINGTDSQGRFGSSVTMLDMDGDGVADLVVSGVPGNYNTNVTSMQRPVLFFFSGAYLQTILPAPGGASVYLNSSDANGTMYLGAPGVGMTTPWHVPALSPAGDIDADGRDDLWVGTPGMSFGAGGVLLVTGKDMPWDGGELVRDGTHVSGIDMQGTGISLGPADIDGDGTTDWVTMGPGDIGSGLGALVTVRPFRDSGIGAGILVRADGAVHTDAGVFTPTFAFASGETRTILVLVENRGATGSPLAVDAIVDMEFLLSSAGWTVTPYSWNMTEIVENVSTFTGLSRGSLGPAFSDTGGAGAVDTGTIPGGNWTVVALSIEAPWDDPGTTPSSLSIYLNGTAGTGDTLLTTSLQITHRVVDRTDLPVDHDEMDIILDVILADLNGDGLDDVVMVAENATDRYLAGYITDRMGPLPRRGSELSLTDADLLVSAAAWGIGSGDVYFDTVNDGTMVAVTATPNGGAVQDQTHTFYTPTMPAGESYDIGNIIDGEATGIFYDWYTTAASDLSLYLSFPVVRSVSGLYMQKESGDKNLDFVVYCSVDSPDGFLGTWERIGSSSLTTTSSNIYFPGTEKCSYLRLDIHAIGGGTSITEITPFGPRDFFHPVASGDWNGDGREDVVMGAPAMRLAYVFFGGSNWASPGAIFVGGSLEPGYGGIVSFLDVNGDMFDDIVVGDPYSGVLDIYLGGITPSTIPSHSLDLGPGIGPVVSLDANGDGELDLLVGDPSWNDHTGRVLVHLGPDLTVTGYLNGTIEGSRFGASLVSLDLPGGAGEELVVSIPYTDVSDTYDGASTGHSTPGAGIEMFSGTGWLNGSHGDGITWMPPGGMLVDALEAADMDGDGTDELIVGIVSSGPSGTDSAVVLVESITGGSVVWSTIAGGSSGRYDRIWTDSHEELGTDPVNVTGGSGLNGTSPWIGSPASGAFISWNGTVGLADLVGSGDVDGDGMADIIIAPISASGVPGNGAPLSIHIITLAGNASIRVDGPAGTVGVLGTSISREYSMTNTGEGEVRVELSVGSPFGDLSTAFSDASSGAPITDGGGPGTPDVVLAPGESMSILLDMTLPTVADIGYGQGALGYSFPVTFSADATVTSGIGAINVDRILTVDLSHDLVEVINITYNTTGAVFDDGYIKDVHMLGDINGDGFEDLALAYPLWDLDTGKVEVYYGGPLVDAVADLVMTGQGAGERFGTDIAALDVTADGALDLLVGVPGLNTVDVFYGGRDIDNVRDNGYGSFADSFGTVLANIGDYDGDGRDDLAVGAPLYDGADVNAGGVFIYLDQAIEGQVGVPPNFYVSGNEAEQLLGARIESAGDIDDDGFEDMAIASPGMNGLAGEVYISLGSPPFTELFADNHSGVVYGPLSTLKPVRTQGNYAFFLRNDSVVIRRNLLTDQVIEAPLPAAHDTFEEFEFTAFGDSFVYVNYDDTSGRRELIEFNITDETYRVLIDDSYSFKRHLDMWDDKVVWTDYTGNQGDIYMMNLTDGNLSTIVVQANAQAHPVIYENMVAWQDMRNGNWDIFMLSLGDDGQFATGDDEPAHMIGEGIVDDGFYLNFDHTDDQISPSLTDGSIAFLDYSMDTTGKGSDPLDPGLGNVLVVDFGSDASWSYGEPMDYISTFIGNRYTVNDTGTSNFTRLGLVTAPTISGQDVVYMYHLSTDFESPVQDIQHDTYIIYLYDTDSRSTTVVYDQRDPNEPVGIPHVEGGKVSFYDGHDNTSLLFRVKRSDALPMVISSVHDRFFGFSMGAGDVNGDGISDLVIGAPGKPDHYLSPASVTEILGLTDDVPQVETLSGRYPGTVHVFYGGDHLQPVMNTTLANVTIRGRASGDLFGYALGVGDLDGDDRHDIVVSAPGVDAPDWGHLTDARLLDDITGGLTLDQMSGGTPYVEDLNASRKEALDQTTGQGTFYLLTGATLETIPDWHAWNGTSAVLPSFDASVYNGFAMQDLRLVGTSISPIRDINKDGNGDVLVISPGWNGSGYVPFTVILTPRVDPVGVFVEPDSILDVDPGQTLDVPITVTNSEETEEEIQVRIDSVLGWTRTMSYASNGTEFLGTGNSTGLITLPGRSAMDFIITVQVPPGLDPFIMESFRVNGTLVSNASRLESAHVNLTVQRAPSITMSTPGGNTSSGPLSDVLEYTVQVVVAGNTHDIINLIGWSPDGWPVEILNETGVPFTDSNFDGIRDSGLRAPNDIVNLTVRVTVPAVSENATGSMIIYGNSTVRTSLSESVELVGTAELTQNMTVSGPLEGTGDNGETVEVVLDFLNEGNRMEGISFNLTQSLDWTIMLLDDTLTPLTNLTGDGNVDTVNITELVGTFALHITAALPADSLGGTVNNLTLLYWPSTDPTLVIQRNVTVSVNRLVGATMTVDEDLLYGQHDDEMNFTYHITNTGNGLELFDLTTTLPGNVRLVYLNGTNLTDNGGGPSVDSGYLLPGEELVFRAVYTVADTIPYGVGEQSFTVVAQSTADPLYPSIPRQVTVEVEHQVSMSEQTPKTIKPGVDTTPYTIIVTNYNNVADEIELELISDLGWNDIRVLIDDAPAVDGDGDGKPETGVLAPGEHVTLRVTVVPPLGTDSGVLHTTTVRGTSLGNGRNNEVDLVTEVDDLFSILVTDTADAVMNTTLVAGATEGSPGDWAEFQFKMTNRGNTPDAFHIQLNQELGFDWDFEIIDGQDGPLTTLDANDRLVTGQFTAGEERLMTLRILVPADTYGYETLSYNDIDIVTLEGDVRENNLGLIIFSDGEVFTKDNAFIDVAVKHTPEFTIGPDQRRAAGQGSYTTYPLTLSNDGNGPDITQLKVEAPAGFVVTMEDASGTLLDASTNMALGTAFDGPVLNTNDETTITVNVSVDGSVTIGTIEDIVITAYSWFEDESGMTQTALGQATLTTEVVLNVQRGVDAAPDRTLSVQPGESAFLEFTVTNTGNDVDVFDLEWATPDPIYDTVVYLSGATVDDAGLLVGEQDMNMDGIPDVPMTDTDSSGFPDTGELESSMSMDIIMVISVPALEPFGNSEIKVARFRSAYGVEEDYVTLTVDVEPADYQLTMIAEKASDQISAIVGDSVENFTVDVVMQGNSVDIINFDSNIPNGFVLEWLDDTGASLNDTNNDTLPDSGVRMRGSAFQVSFRIIVPLNVEIGWVYNVTVEAVSASNPAEISRLSYRFTADSPEKEADVTLVDFPDTIEVEAGTSTTFEVEVRNDGNLQDSIGLRLRLADGNSTGWTYTVVEPTIRMLAAGESHTFIVNVSASLDVPPGSQLTLTLNTTAAFGSFFKHDNMTLETTPAKEAGLVLEGPVDAVDAPTGMEITVPFTITNIGDYEDNVSLVVNIPWIKRIVDGDGARITHIVVPSDSEEEFAVMVTVPASERLNRTFTLKVTATSLYGHPPATFIQEVDLITSQGGRVSIGAISMSSIFPQGQQVFVTIPLQNSVKVDQTVTITVEDVYGTSTTPLKEQERTIPAESSADIDVTWIPSGAGSHSLRITITGTFEDSKDIPFTIQAAETPRPDGPIPTTLPLPEEMVDTWNEMITQFGQGDFVSVFEAMADPQAYTETPLAAISRLLPFLLIVGIIVGVRKRGKKKKARKEKDAALKKDDDGTYLGGVDPYTGLPIEAVPDPEDGLAMGAPDADGRVPPPPPPGGDQYQYDQGAGYPAEGGDQYGYDQGQYGDQYGYDQSQYGDQAGYDALPQGQEIPSDGGYQDPAMDREPAPRADGYADAGAMGAAGAVQSNGGDEMDWGGDEYGADPYGGEAAGPDPGAVSDIAGATSYESRPSKVEDLDWSFAK